MDWLVVIVGLIGFWLAGNKIWWSWYVNLGCQVLGFVFGLVTEQYAFIVSSIVYAFVFGRNATKWTREHKDELRKSEDPIGWIDDIQEDENGLKVSGKFYENFDPHFNHIAMPNNEEPDFDRNIKRFLLDPEMPALKPRGYSGGRLRALHDREGVPGSRRSGKVRIPNVEWLEPYDTEEYVRGYFRQLESLLGVSFVYEVRVEMPIREYWLHWECTVPLLGPLDPWGPRHETDPEELERLRAHRVERLGESDQGPVFFSDKELEGDSELLQDFAASLEVLAFELGCTVNLRLIPQPGGVLAHWDWV